MCTPPTTHHSIALTAAAHGAAAANYIELVQLLHDPHTGQVCGGRVRDTLSGEQWDVRAKYVVNATGAFSDAVRHLTPTPTSTSTSASTTNSNTAASSSSSSKQPNKPLPDLIAPSTGTHLVVSSRYCPPDMGLIVPKTEDGRVLFMLPWEGSTLMGTTDDPCAVQPLPAPKEGEVEWILKQVSVRQRELSGGGRGVFVVVMCV
jgi:glycerol-3-phosphate dehydrogenase